MLTVEETRGRQAEPFSPRTTSNLKIFYIYMCAYVKEREKTVDYRKELSRYNARYMKRKGIKNADRCIHKNLLSLWYINEIRLKYIISW